MTRLIFGFGSLVTRATHSYVWKGVGTVDGYQRVWVPSPEWDMSLLSVQPHAGTRISGSILEVSDHDWPGLLEREKGYDVHRLSPSALEPKMEGVALFVGRPDSSVKQNDRPLLQSYLDTVITGFVENFGTDGARAFFQSTIGWEAGIKRDRDTPIYPRTVPLSSQVRDLVDDELEKLGL